MKNIFINNKNISRDSNASQEILENLEDHFTHSALNITGVEVFSDLKYDTHGNLLSDKQIKMFQALNEYSLFIGQYLKLILSDNELAEGRSPSPYDVYVSLTLDAAGHKAKMHFYLDGEIFGLVAGSGYINIVNFIRASFPIFNKIGVDIEFKLFPITFDAESEDSEDVYVYSDEKEEIE